MVGLLHHEIQYQLHLAQVRDEKGRRRLHGAFTGGFSAGYFNSVGSKEGMYMGCLCFHL